MVELNSKEIIEIVKESNLWASLTGKEKQEAFMHALKSARLSITEQDIKNTVGKVYLENTNFTEKSKKTGKQ